MMSAPQPYPTVGANIPAPDDAQIEKKMPSICVDYLSHNWAQEDVWQSWRAMTKRKNEIANGVRLENASWRTWAKQRGNLKTINPETLNWLKDSDVTWLYGPLHEHADPVPPPKIASTQDRLDLEITSQKKSILKHRTISEMLATPGRSASPGGDALANLVDGNVSSNVKENKPKILSVKSDTNLTKKRRGAGGSPPASERLLSHPTLHRSDTTASDEKRHISFNQRVDQCIAVDYIEEELGYSDGDYEDDEGSEEEESASDEEEPLTMRSSRGGASPSQTSLSARSSSSINDHHTIAKLAPTMLKTTDVFPAPSPAVVDPTGFSTGGASGSRSQSRFDYDDEQQIHLPQSEWDDDATGSFDYFNGPFVSDVAEDEPIAGVISTPGAAPKNSTMPPYEPPKNAHVLVNGHPAADGTSSASSNTASLGSSHPPAIPRSILKRRPQGHHSSSYDSSGGDEASYNSNGPDGNGIGGAAYPAEGHDDLAHLEARTAHLDIADSSDGESTRGRPSHRLGSTSYERIQEAARRGGVRSASSSSSGSPSGSLENASGFASRVGGGGGSAAAFGAGGSSSSSSGPQSPPERERRGSFRGRDSDGHQRSGAAARLGLGPGVGSSSSGDAAVVDGSSPSLPSSPAEEEYVESRTSSTRNKRLSGGSGGGVAGVKARGSSTHSGGSMSPAGSQRLSVDLDNLPSNDPGSFSSTPPSGQSSGGGNGGPTPLNTPTLALARSRGGTSSSSSKSSGKRNHSSSSSSSYSKGNEPGSGSGSGSGPSPSSPILPRRTSATGALVAPSDADRQAGVRVPLADDYVEEDEGGIVGRAVEIVNTARDLIAAVWPRSK